MDTTRFCGAINQRRTYINGYIFTKLRYANFTEKHFTFTKILPDTLSIKYKNLFTITLISYELNIPAKTQENFYSVEYY